mmetsp:Transcript_79308/g.256800  ORF Transcript_79308/g.256800 Transcript_79308/m.256800 type:complete len:311 (+) Transcript_79308:239-1171(+)
MPARRRGPAPGCCPGRGRVGTGATKVIRAALLRVAKDLPGLLCCAESLDVAARLVRMPPQRGTTVRPPELLCCGVSGRAQGTIVILAGGLRRPVLRPAYPLGQGGLRVGVKAQPLGAAEVAQRLHVVAASLQPSHGTAKESHGVLRAELSTGLCVCQGEVKLPVRPIEAAAEMEQPLRLDNVACPLGHLYAASVLLKLGCWEPRAFYRGCHALLCLHAAWRRFPLCLGALACMGIALVKAIGPRFRVSLAFPPRFCGLLLPRFFPPVVLLLITLVPARIPCVVRLIPAFSFPASVFCIPLVLPRFLSEGR